MILKHSSNAERSEHDTGRRIPWKELRWIFLGVLWLSILLVGYIGFSKYNSAHKIPATSLDLIYATIQLVVLESGSITSPIPLEVEIARFALPTLAAITAVTTLAIIFLEQARQVRLRIIRNHVVICGLGRMGSLLTNSFIDRGDAVVVIELNKDNPLIEQVKARGAIVLTGTATDAIVLGQAGVQRASSLIAVCGDDRVNAEIAIRAQQVVKTRRLKPLNCRIPIVDPQLYELLVNKELGGHDFSSIRLELFNVFDQGAKLMLQEFTPFNPDEEGRGSHILVVGIGNFGESLIVHAARTWTMDQPSSDHRLKITVIDRDAERKCEVLSIRYPQLPKRCEVHPLSIEFDSPIFHRSDFLFTAGKSVDVDIIYICLDDDSQGLSVSQTLLRRLPDQQVPIVIRTQGTASLAGFLSSDDEGRNAFQRVHTFSLLDRTCTPDLLSSGPHEYLARALHEEYVRQQTKAGSAEGSSSLSWDQLPEPTKESNRKQVDRIGANLEAVGCRIAPLMDWDSPLFAFTPAEIEVIARREHEGWCDDLRRGGWVFAPGSKNTKKKTHPDLVEWDHLHEPEKEKNRAPVRKLPNFLTRAGYRIDRVC
ncbi:MAG: NAD-binding protein [Anaerolineales bacterium]|nr:NAD-binding protein [Anaerolineales bacterium]